MVTLPVKVGAVMLAFTKQRFREQGWVDSSSQPWKPRKSTAKRNKGRALLIDKGRLWRATRITRITAGSVTIGNDTPYAKIHNEGFYGEETVKAHTRKRFKKERIDTVTKSGKSRKQTIKNITGESNVIQHTKTMRMPKRQFMGHSMYLNNQIERLMASEIMKIFK